MIEHEFTGFSGTYIYVRGRQLEGTFNNDPSVGMWGISGCRVARGWGNTPRHLFPVQDEWPPFEPPGLDDAAKENRILLYQTIRDASEAIHFLANYGAVSAAFNITRQWFNAPEGVVSLPGSGDEFVGAHAISLLKFDHKYKIFLFANSWGTEWGDAGFGYLPLDYFESHFFDAWVFCGLRDQLPVQHDETTQLIEWGLPDAVSGGLIHLIEMYDPRFDERIGWAFAVERAEYLDIEEIFVKPQYRHQGIGRQFAETLVKRGNVLGRPLRLWISYADAANLKTIPVQAILTTLGLNSVRLSDNRWSAYVATAGDDESQKTLAFTPPTWFSTTSGT